MKTLKLLVVFLMAGIYSYAQTTKEPSFENLISEKAKYKAIFQLNSDDETVIKSTLTNINNAMADSKLIGQIKIELVVHGNGVVLFMKDHPYEKQVKELKEKGVILAQCLNTMKNKNISKEQLFPFIFYVESGVGELILRQQQGWAYIHP